MFCKTLYISPLSCSDIDEEVQTVKQFSSELIVQAVVRCLRVIDPAMGNGLSPTLPPGMSARFRVGMSLAQACQVREKNFFLYAGHMKIVSIGDSGSHNNI